MKKALILFLSLSLLLVTKGSVCSESPDAAEEIILYSGQMKTVSASSPQRIVIGKPEVADVTAATETEITIAAKSPGTTTFIFWDSLGEWAFRVRVFAEDMSETKLRVDNLLKELNAPGVYTKAVDSEAKVWLMGEVKTSQERERVFTALGALKDKIIDLIKIREEEAVVDIDMEVLEVSKDATSTLGFTWPGSITLAESGSPGIGTSAPTQVGLTQTVAAGAAIGTKFSTLFKVLNLSRAAFQWSLDALVQQGKATVLSRPRLACQSGKEAELMVGGEKPIITTEVAASSGASGTSVSYKEFGIKLKIKPTVNEEGRIKLGLNMEVSDIGTAETIGSTTQTTARAYPLTKRSASTELFLDNGQTLAIGGLIKQKSEEDLRKMPWLGDVPVLGLFFKKKTTTAGGGQGERGDTELFITITPTIVKREKKEAAKDEEKIKPPQIKQAGTVPAVEPEVEKKAEPDDPVARYARIIQKRISENIKYPKKAEDSGFKGTVTLSLLLSYRGQLLDAKIKKSSGYQVLDDYTLSVAKEIASYPPFPPSIKSEELWLDMSILYKLD